MTTYRRNAGDGLSALFKGRKISRGAAWGIMIIVQLQHHRVRAQRCAR